MTRSPNLRARLAATKRAGLSRKSSMFALNARPRQATGTPGLSATSRSAAEGVYGRIAALCQGSAVVDRKRKEGAEDPVAQWLEEAFDLRDLEREAFIDEVVEKLEG